jgi:DNA-binding transcriptional MerR regulator
MRLRNSATSRSGTAAERPIEATSSGGMQVAGLRREESEPARSETIIDESLLMDAGRVNENLRGDCQRGTVAACRHSPYAVSSFNMGSPGASATSEIPDKLYFRIGDVSRLVGVKPYVLRYWETEFPSISPKKSGTGQRLYRRKDVELILQIKNLLYEKRYTIEGARKTIEQRGKAAGVATQGALFDSTQPDLDMIKRELQEILNLLERDV